MLDKDWIVSGNNITAFFNNSDYKSILKNVNDGGAFIDIGAITYSMGKDFLNATFLFNSDITKTSNLSTLSYGMLLDVDNSKDTGIDGWDYLIKVTVNNSTFTRQLLEIFPNGMMESRHSESHKDYPGLKSNSADLYLSWKEINKPGRFSVMFFVSDDINVGKSKYTIIDGSDWIIIPPFEVNLKAEPYNFDIEAGETKIIEWSANSSSKGYGVTSMFLNDKPISLIPAYVPNRGLPTRLLGSVSNPVCYESTVTPDLIVDLNRKLKPLATSGNHTVSEAKTFLESLNLPNNVTGINQMEPIEFNAGQVDGIRVIRTPTLDNFYNFDTYYHQIKVQTLENASRGLNYLTLRTSVIDSRIDPTLNYFYSLATALGNQTFSSCAQRYHEADLGEREFDVRINVLPPKDSVKKFNDFLRNYDTLVTLAAGLLSGGLIFTLVSVIRKVLRNRKNNLNSGVGQ